MHVRRTAFVFGDLYHERAIFEYPDEISAEIRIHGLDTACTIADFVYVRSE